MARLCFPDLWHHAITELAESQASDSTVGAIAGHVSPKMLQHYSHVRLQAKRTALDVLSLGQFRGRRKSSKVAEARGLRKLHFFFQPEGDWRAFSFYED
jgi:hypothetical protein